MTNRALCLHVGFAPVAPCHLGSAPWAPRPVAPCHLGSAPCGSVPPGLRALGSVPLSSALYVLRGQPLIDAFISICFLSGGVYRQLVPSPYAWWSSPSRLRAVLRSWCNHLQCMVTKKINYVSKSLILNKAHLGHRRKISHQITTAICCGQEGGRLSWFCQHASQRNWVIQSILRMESRVSNLSWPPWLAGYGYWSASESMGREDI